MNIFFRNSCVVFSFLILLSCGGGGGDSTPPAPTPNISLAQSIDFAGIILDNSEERILEITNTGNANLQIGQISTSQLIAPFSISNENCSNATLTPSNKCSLRVRFFPRNQGPFTARLSIPSNDPDASTTNINLSGEGYGLNVWINSINPASCSSNGLISVDVTVTDSNPNSTNNVLLRSLSESNFTLRQNGQPLPITLLPNIYPAPVSLVLALDSSGSTVNIMPDIKLAATAFVNRLNNGDWALICKFYKDMEFSTATGFTDAFANKVDLNAYINNSVSGSGTAIYEAVSQSIARAAQGSTDKRAVIVLSDGEDTASVSTLDQVIANAKREGIPVFTIYYADPNLAGGSYGNQEIMQRLARETGGQYYNSTTADFNTIFEQITNVLSNKYTINYTSTTCSGTISLDLRSDWGGLYGQDLRIVNLP